MPTAASEPARHHGGDRPAVMEAVTRLNIGGPAHHVLSVAKGLGDRFDIRVACGRPPALEGEIPAGAVAVDHLPLVRALDPRSDLAALAGMRQLLRRRHVRLVHSHMAKAGTVARLAALSLPHRPRAIHTFHGHVLAGYFTPRVEAAFAQAERQLAKRTDVLVAVSAEVRDALLDLRIGLPAQYEVIPLGVDLAPYLAVDGRSGTLRQALGIPPHAPLVGVVARLAPVKDHETLLDAMVGVAGAHLAVLGDGELRPTLEERARQLGIAERVHFAGWWHDMPAAYADIDVVALTSRNEGTPMALIEAAAAGRPVVATDVGGVRDVVIDGRTGRVVPPQDPTAVAIALQDLLADDGLRRRLGQAGRAHVQDRFSLQSSITLLGALYDEVLAAPTRRSTRPRHSRDRQPDS